jgi:hypothetical protein
MYTRNIIGAGWSEANYPVENDWWGVAFGNGLFVATAVSGVGNRVMTSPDGINWTIRASVADSIWKGICYGNGTFVSVSSNGTVMTNDYTANDNMLVLNSGISSNVGIGTNKPRTSLDVNGGISAYNIPKRWQSDILFGASYIGGATRYYLLGTLGDYNASGNWGTMNIQGSMGGLLSSQITVIDAIITTRSGSQTPLTSGLLKYYNSSSTTICDIVVYIRVLVH